jgi:hypothetical protein
MLSTAASPLMPPTPDRMPASLRSEVMAEFLVDSMRWNL